MRRGITKLYAEHVRHYVKIIAKRDFRKNHPDKIKNYRMLDSVKEKQRLRMRKKRSENPNLVKEQYQKHKVRHKKSMDKHRAKPEVKKQTAKYNKRWAEENPDLVLENNKRHMKRLAGKTNLSWTMFMSQLKGWAKIIQQDCNEKCQVCGGKSTQAHHIIHKTLYPHLAFNRSNGIALCDQCHYEVHGKML